MKFAWILVLLTIAAGLFPLETLAKKLPKGSYRETCRNIRRHGPHLEAYCQKRDGGWRWSHLNLKSCRDRNIGNHNGRLQCGDWQRGHHLPEGSYKTSCRKIRTDGYHLEAKCQKRDGGWRWTDINLYSCNRNIVNNNGRLECGSWQTRLPKGTYKQSCRKIRVEGHHLEAKCLKLNGDWRPTHLNLYKCSGRRVYNDNGRLRCVL